MISPKNPPPNPAVSSTEDLRTLNEAFAAQNLLTAHQAAQHIGIPYSTFKYHMLQGHLHSLVHRDTRTYLVTREDAERFAHKLQAWRDQSEGFDWLTDDLEEPEETDKTNGTIDAISASA